MKSNSIIPQRISLKHISYIFIVDLSLHLRHSILLIKLFEQAIKAFFLFPRIYFCPHLYFCLSMIFHISTASDRHHYCLQFYCHSLCVTLTRLFLSYFFFCIQCRNVEKKFFCCRSSRLPLCLSVSLKCTLFLFTFFFLAHSIVRWRVSFRWHVLVHKTDETK